MKHLDITIDLKKADAVKQDITQLVIDHLLRKNEEGGTAVKSEGSLSIHDDIRVEELAGGITNKRMCNPQCFGVFWDVLACNVCVFCV